jgi:16S rRNA (cytosine1402-N4)-methyltransferase
MKGSFNMEFTHKPVLLDECIEGLNIKSNGIYVDGTLGLAGHSICILQRLKKDGKLIGIDRDKEALKKSGERLKDYNNKILVHGNHDDIRSLVNNLGIEKVDGILLDLGVSSLQLDDKTRGFSYMKNSDLDMRMNQEDDITAFYVINNYTEEQLIKIFYEYGEEKYSKSIAKKIVEKRKEKEILTTFELVDIIKSAIPKKALNEKQHPAKRIFQAIRIEVNNELKDLKNTIIDSIDLLDKGGRLAIITFHSLEDKIVKHTYEDFLGKCICPKGLPLCVCGKKEIVKLITKKPIISNQDELSENHRARSAKLRIVEKL